ncbi:MAG: MazG nucleotide pyrophosphohydrolase domain-containing protein [Bacteroidota bacterium]
MAHLPDRPTLADLQSYQAAICKERGWDQTSDLEAFLLFTEEIGELAKAIRNRRELYQEQGKSPKSGELEGEFADVLSYLMELANRFGIDLEQVYRAKEEVNAGREWGSGG